MPRFTYQSVRCFLNSPKNCKHYQVSSVGIKISTVVNISTVSLRQFWKKENIWIQFIGTPASQMRKQVSNISQRSQSELISAMTSKSATKHDFDILWLVWLDLFAMQRTGWMSFGDLNSPRRTKAENPSIVANLAVFKRHWHTEQYCGPFQLVYKRNWIQQVSRLYFLTSISITRFMGEL